MCHCTLQQTSLLIRSPRIRRGIWTVCSGADRMMAGPREPPRSLSSCLHFLFQTRYKGMRVATLEGAFGAIPPSSGRFAPCEPCLPVLPQWAPLPGPFNRGDPSVASSPVHFISLSYCSFMHWLHIRTQNMPLISEHTVYMLSLACGH